VLVCGSVYIAAFRIRAKDAVAMGVANSISRLTEYCRRHGLIATIRRATVAGRRALFARRMVVFYCDLDERKLPPVRIPKTLFIERVEVLSEMRAEHLREITSFWNSKLANRNIRERFEKGASLWLVKSDDRLAGYGWTLRGRTIAPYYFPLGPDDVQLFDFYVFPRFRGRAIHWLLTSYILHMLATEGGTRAFADTGEWNQAQLASFKLTPLRSLGFVRTYKVFGQLFTRWAVAREVTRDQQMGTVRRQTAMKVLSSNE
jgi:ribosomal protein S18 acetylase RimI-like enzyme